MNEPGWLLMLVPSIIIGVILGYRSNQNVEDIEWGGMPNAVMYAVLLIVYLTGAWVAHSELMTNAVRGDYTFSSPTYAGVILVATLCVAAASWLVSDIVFKRLRL